MSLSLSGWSLASADDLLLTNDECFLLLDTDLLENDDDLFKTFPCAAPKKEALLGEYQLPEDTSSSSLYPSSPLSPQEAKPSRSELASDLLQQLDNQCKQENIFSNWLEEKVDLPIFDGIHLSERTDVILPSSLPFNLPAAVSAYPQPQPTEELLREFETVYDAVELTHLTPPQSPPGPATKLLLSYVQQAQCVQVPATQWQISSQQQSQPELDCELAAVEELVRNRAAELASPEPTSGSASPRSSPPSSPSSSTDDDYSHVNTCVRARAKPYSRSVDDRRSRKKEQNKNAATRYRQKKKAEIEVLLNEENNFRQRHTELDSKCSDLQREIRYLKSLMRDLFKAKGLIK